MKVVILCGGKGTRMRDETEFRPKPMIPIGGRPILWHIMKLYAHHGHREFILCLGHKGHMIKEYFRNFQWHNGNVTISPTGTHFHGVKENWTVTLADTGEESGTGHRLSLIQRHLDLRESFLLTYGDGLADVDINAVISAHRLAGRFCTLTAVHPPGKYGALKLGEDGLLSTFSEKQVEAGWVNGGFMVCDHAVFNYLNHDPALMFEREPMERLASQSHVNVFQHAGFWQPMDTPQEMQYLNALWASEKAPWKIW